jgi:ketosteroid isomerase-like protein
VSVPAESDDGEDTTMSEALRVALDYFTAWTGGDMEKAMRYVADDVVCDAPAGRIEGAAAYRGFMTPFAGMLVRARLLSAFGDDATATVVYDTETTLVPSAPAAEWVTVRDGRIAYSRFIFDRLPFQAARSAARSAHSDVHSAHPSTGGQ